MLINKEPVRDYRASLQSKEKAVKSLNKGISSPSGSSRNSIVLSCGIRSRTAPLGPNLHKNRARESIAIHTPDFLPMKLAKRRLLLLSYLVTTRSSQALSCIYANSPGYKPNLLVSSTDDQISRIRNL